MRHRGQLKNGLSVSHKKTSSFSFPRQAHSGVLRARNGRLAATVICCLWVAAVCGTVAADDWATYRHDVRRGGATEETVGPELTLQWQYSPTHPPKPAWPLPAEELPRMHEDCVYAVAVADGRVYFGSSVTNEVVCMDAASGEKQWSFFTEGPVRLAPTVDTGRVYFGSDDGHVYCLRAKNGKLVWKYRPGPSDEKVIGNGRMISLWPVRTSVLVDNGQAMFTAGVFPYEGLYICCVDAEDGSEIWTNDTIGDQAHALEFGGMSPHGYLVASSEVLYVPSGRSTPAGFDRRNGEFLFYSTPGAKRGGTWTLLDEDQLIAGVEAAGFPTKIAYSAKTGAPRGTAYAWFPGIDMALTPEVSYVLTRDGMFAIDRAVHAEAEKEGKKLEYEREKLTAEIESLRTQRARAEGDAREILDKQVQECFDKIGGLDREGQRLKESTIKWRYEKKGLNALIVAGDAVFAGGQNVVLGLDARTGAEAWQTEVAGRAAGLAASGGRLLVSTDEGPVYCFGEQPVSDLRSFRPVTNDSPYSDDKFAAVYESAASRIVEETGIDKGYCVVLDCGEGRLAFELAKRTHLKIIGIEPNADKCSKARACLGAAGLLGSRVVVEPWQVADLPEGFANLIVSDGMLRTGKSAIAPEEWSRLLRPWGGTALLGEQKTVNGPLEGAGNWTQQFANPQNTACSDDERVNGPLGILWFGDPGPKGMVERHGNAQSPVSFNGRLFVQGEERILAVDAFNGTLLWERDLPGAVRVWVKGDAGNLVVTADGLYVAAHDKCHRLDPATGETIRVYEIPGLADDDYRRWGYVSVVGNVLYGSAATPFGDDYAGFWDTFVEDGKWKELDSIPPRYARVYDRLRPQFPVPDENLWMALERHGALYGPMVRFPRGGEFTQKGAVSPSIMTSNRIFAMDTETGGLLWMHKGNQIANVTLSLGDGKLFFAESVITPEQRTQALEDRRKLIAAGVYKEREGVLEELEAAKKKLDAILASGRPYDRENVTYPVRSLAAELFREEVEEGSLGYEDADVRVAVALDALTGEKRWEKVVDLTGCCGDLMGTAYGHGMMYFFGNFGNHDAWRFRDGWLKWRRITALSAENGDMVWSRPLNYRTRPVLMADRIIIEPRACDPYTGEILTRSHPVTGQDVPWEFLRPGHTCGITAASAAGLFYRSACTAFYDLERDRGVTIFGGYRPGCAISLIPASGLLLSPEASAGCTCSYPIRSSVALVRKPERTQPWTVYVTPGDNRPAKHLAVNFGAVADMKAEDGTVWFAYPNPITRIYTHFPNYGVKFDLHGEVLEGMGYFCRDHKGAVLAGADKPWLFTSGCVGLVRCSLPLIDASAGQAPGVYTVRLGFKAQDGDQPKQRVFDVRIQGKTVLDRFDIVKAEAGRQEGVVQEFAGVQVTDDLALELIPKEPNPDAAHAPVINFIEVVREDTPGGVNVASAP